MIDKKKKIITFFVLLIFVAGLVIAQEPYRRGTTAGNFLEIGYGSRGAAMGDAVVATTDDIESVYWNPAGLALMRKSAAAFSMQPWFVDINTNFAAAALVFPRYGTFAFSFYQMDYGKEAVTTLDMQEGTGEHYSANDFAFSLSYARRLAQWFAFGASGKFVTSNIWHSNANALALDLGTMVNTFFFSPTGERTDGLTIGMSISNYGTRMQYQGMDLLRPIDPNPDQAGEFGNVEGQYKTQSWELPLIFRIGIALHPIVTTNSRLTMEVNALHPNNNSESVNFGGQYRYTLPSFGSFYLRAGYKGLFMPESEFGMSYGFGVLWRVGSLGMKLNYAFRDIGILGNVNSYSFSLMF